MHVISLGMIQKNISDLKQDMESPIESQKQDSRIFQGILYTASPPTDEFPSA
jgi:hypothetical protein